MKNQWDQFGIAYETFSVWISDKEKQLEVLKSSTLPLEQQISTVKVQCCVFTAVPCTAIHFSVFWTTLMATLLWLKCCVVHHHLVHPGCCCRALRAGRGSFAAGGRFPEPGPVCIIRGGSSHQGPSDPDRQVLGGVKGEHPAAGWAARGKLLSPPEIQIEPRGGKWAYWHPNVATAIQEL